MSVTLPCFTIQFDVFAGSFRISSLLAHLESANSSVIGGGGVTRLQRGCCGGGESGFYVNETVATAKSDWLWWGALTNQVTD